MPVQLPDLMETHENIEGLQTDLFDSIERIVNEPESILEELSTIAQTIRKIDVIRKKEKEKKTNRKQNTASNTSRTS